MLPQELPALTCPVRDKIFVERFPENNLESRRDFTLQRSEIRVAVDLESGVAPNGAMIDIVCVSTNMLSLTGQMVSHRRLKQIYNSGLNRESQTT